MRLTLNIDAFRWRLAETIAWCAKHARADKPEFCLRYTDWRPPSFYYSKDVFSPYTIVDALAEKRLEGLQDWRRESTVKKPATDLAGGRLFVYYPYANLCDGAAEAETAGFLDINNEPPWDTWLCFMDEPDLEGMRRNESFSSYLVSWIPPQFIELVDGGINVNPEACILWATDVDTPFTQQAP